MWPHACRGARKLGMHRTQRGTGIETSAEQPAKPTTGPDACIGQHSPTVQGSRRARAQEGGRPAAWHAGAAAAALSLGRGRAWARARRTSAATFWTLCRRRYGPARRRGADARRRGAAGARVARPLARLGTSQPHQAGQGQPRDTPYAGSVCDARRVHRRETAGVPAAARRHTASATERACCFWSVGAHGGGRPSRPRRAHTRRAGTRQRPAAAPAASAP